MTRIRFSSIVKQIYIILSTKHIAFNKHTDEINREEKKTIYHKGNEMKNIILKEKKEVIIIIIIIITKRVKINYRARLD